MKHFASALALALSTPVIANAEIIGADGLRRVPDRDSVDRSTVAILDSTNHVRCTGTSIGISHVLTAAHCVIDDDGMPIRDLRYAPGIHMADNYKPSTRFPAKRIYVLSDYLVGRSAGAWRAESDIAVVQILEYTEGAEWSDAAPRLPLGPVLDVAFEEPIVQTFTYLSDSGPTQFFQSGGCSILGALYGRIRHDCDTKVGAAGMALYADGAVRAINVGSGVNDNVAAPLVPWIIAEIDRATFFEKTGFEFFTVLEVDEPAWQGLDLLNGCGSTIYGYVAYTGPDGLEIATPRFEIAPGQRILTTVKAIERRVWIHARTIDGTGNWSGDRRLVLDGKEELGFRPYDIDAAALDDDYLRFNCD